MTVRDPTHGGNRHGRAEGLTTLACYWASSCGGCDIAILDIGSRLIALLQQRLQIVFWPCIADFKRDAVSTMNDGSIDICLFNGAIRTEENRHLAELLRAKSKCLVAFGSCAHEGCVPGLANLWPTEKMLQRIYIDSPSVDNPRALLPQRDTSADANKPNLTALCDRVRPLDEVVPVDAIVPGCPPTTESIWEALQALLSWDGSDMGRLLGAGDRSVCDECELQRSNQTIARFHRPHQFIPHQDGRRCLLEQGLVCSGPATRSGCGALCPQANAGCRGCYGPTTDDKDQGLTMMGVLGTLAGEEDPVQDTPPCSELADPTGTLYRFGLASSLWHRTASGSGSGDDDPT